MAKKKTPTKRPEASGISAFREYQQKLIKQDVEERIEAKTQQDVISSGSIVIDHIIGNGGFVRGDVHEIAGEAHSGKTTICLTAARNVLRQGGLVYYFNPEQSMDIRYAKSLGLDTDSENFWYTTQNHYEDLAPLINGCITVGNADLIIIDSVTSVKEKGVMESDEGFKSSQIGVAARFWSEYAAKLKSLAHKNNVCVLYTNQTRVANIGQYGVNPSKDTTGGNALKFYKGTSLHLFGRKPKATEGTDEFGDKYWRVDESYTIVRADVDKNKWGPAYQSAMARVVPYLGYDNFDAVFKLALAKGLIMQSGAWLTYGNEGDENYFKVQGKDNAYQKVRNDKQLLSTLVKELGFENPENYFVDSSVGS